MPHRYICSVLDEMRECMKTQNYSYLPGLLEECQTLANRMESALWEQKDITDLYTELKALEKDKDKLKNKIAKLKIKKRELS